MALTSHRATGEDVDEFLLRHGYDYVGEVDANLDCPICRSPFVDPVLSPECSHVFCRPCLDRHISTSLTCPVDRKALDPAAIKTAPPLIRNMVNELLVRCPHHKSHGCPFASQRHLLRAHLLTSCLFVETSCPCSRDCDLVVLKRDLPAHVDTCEYALLPCPMSCGAHVRRSELDHHADALCPRKEVECSFRCGRKGLTRAELADHYREECPKAPIDCPFRRFGCSWRGTRRVLNDEHLLAECAYEGIKAYLEATEARLTKSEAEKEELTVRLTRMEERQEWMLSEMKALRTTLGDFAPMSATRQSEASTSTAAAKPTTLPGKLDEIGTSIASLQQSLESLEVRHEVTVVHETVRLQDEVQALRAAVHGVRMQACWLMMEHERRSAGEEGSDGAASMDWRNRPPAALFAGMPGPPMMPMLSPPAPASMPMYPFARRTSERQDTKL